MVSKEALTQFRKLYKARYGVTLTEEDTVLRANGLLNLYRAVYEPDINIQIKNGKTIQNKHH